MDEEEGETPMNAFTSIFRRPGQLRAAPASARRRPGRSFRSSFAPLEGRALLSTVGPMSIASPTLSATTAALIGTTSVNSGQAMPPPQPGPSSNGPGGVSGSSTLPRAVDRLDQLDDHVAMDVARVDQDGRSSREFALADFDQSEVYVRSGPGGSAVELGPSQGVDHPFAVKLADLNGDGIPDLIVANTNADDVLVFPGLADGQFAAEINGGKGIAVGVAPVSLSVDYVAGDPDRAQLIVANKGSDDISVIDGQASGGTWSPSLRSTIATQIAPVTAITYDVNSDGTPDLLVCNSGSDSVTLYQGQGDGAFDAVPTATYATGSTPEAMFVGPFQRRDQLDLVTVNSTSDDVTFIAGAFGARPTTQTISSGGASPDAAFAIDPSRSGVLDLVVANGGDGRLAVFRGGTDGLQLAGVITPSGVPAPTALAPGSSGGDGIDFFAVSAGEDAASLLHFDLGVASTYLPGSSDESGAISPEDEELFAQLMPGDDSSLGLFAALWAGSPESDAVSGERALHEATTITALYSPTEGQGIDDKDKPADEASLPSSPPAASASALPADDASWARFVIGVEESLDRPREAVAAVASRDLPDELGDRASDGLARLDLGSDAAAGSGAVDEALRLFWSEGTPRPDAPPAESPSKPAPSPASGGLGEAAALEVRVESVPLISSALVVSAGLILKASPPRPPGARIKSWIRRFVSLGNDPKAGGRPGSL